MTLASMHETPRFVTHDTPWVATAKFVTTSGQEPIFTANSPQTAF
jgi:hypothetical protein